MPADPEPPPAPPAVEAMLRDAARRRREAFDAAGPGASSMPGPMRTRLHAELARQFHDATPSGTRVGWRRLTRWRWPALAGAVGVVAAAVLAVFVVTGPRRPTASPVAVNAGSRPAPLSPPAASEPAPAPVVAPPPLISSAGETTNDTVARAQQAMAPPVPEAVRTQTFTRSPLPLATALRAAAPPAPASPHRRDAAAAAAASSAPAAGSGNAPTLTPLLGNFRFEQRGENVRVVDADGSVYVGHVQPEELSKADAAKQAPPAGVQKQAPAAKAESRQAEAGESFRFRATGDSRTLRQPVVFEGEYSSVQTSQKPQTPVTKPTPADAEAAPAAQIRGLLRVLDGRDDQRGAEVDARSVGPATPE